MSSLQINKPATSIGMMLLDGIRDACFL